MYTAEHDTDQVDHAFMLQYDLNNPPLGMDTQHSTAQRGDTWAVIGATKKAKLRV